MRGWAWGAGLRAAGWGNGLLGRWGRGWRGATGPPARAAAHEHEQAAGREARWPRGGGARSGPRCWAAQRVSRMGLAEGWKGVFLFISNLFLYPFSFPIKFIHKNDPRIKWMHTQGNMSDQNNSVTA
jgi:hypothetical protein